MNLCRLGQGLSVAGLGVVIRAVAKDCYSDKDLTKAMTYISTAWALGPIIGPFIGGYLQHLFNWKFNFYFYAIYGVLLCLYIFIIKETHPTPTKLR